MSLQNKLNGQNESNHKKYNKLNHMKLRNNLTLIFLVYSFYKYERRTEKQKRSTVTVNGGKSKLKFILNI